MSETERYYRISIRKDRHGNWVWRIERVVEIHNAPVRPLGNGYYLYQYNWVRSQYEVPSQYAVREFLKWLDSQKKKKGKRW